MYNPYLYEHMNVRVFTYKCLYVIVEDLNHHFDVA